jgi:hypothetical protein
VIDSKSMTSENAVGNVTNFLIVPHQDYEQTMRKRPM